MDFVDCSTTVTTALAEHTLGSVHLDSSRDCDSHMGSGNGTSSQRQQQQHLASLVHALFFRFWFFFFFFFLILLPSISRRSRLNLNIKYSVRVYGRRVAATCEEFFCFKNSTKLKTCCEHILLIKYRFDDVLVVAWNVWSLLLVANTLSRYCGSSSLPHTEICVSVCGLYFIILF